MQVAAKEHEKELKLVASTVGRRVLWMVGVMVHHSVDNLVAGWGGDSAVAKAARWELLTVAELAG